MTVGTVPSFVTLELREEDFVNLTLGRPLYPELADKYDEFYSLPWLQKPSKEEEDPSGGPDTITFEADHIKLSSPPLVQWFTRNDFAAMKRRTFEQARAHQASWFRSHVLGILYGALEDKVEIDIPRHVCAHVVAQIALEMKDAGFERIEEEGRKLVVTVPRPKIIYK